MHNNNAIIAFKLIEVYADVVRKVLEQIQCCGCPHVGNGVILSPQFLSAPEVNNCAKYRIWRITIPNHRVTTALVLVRFIGFPICDPPSVSEEDPRRMSPDNLSMETEVNVGKKVMKPEE